MRIVALADTHSRHEMLQIPEGDILIHAGDLTQNGSLAETQQALDFFRALPHRHKVLVAGNHDLAFEFTRADPYLGGFHYLRDSAVEIEGLRFWGSPWHPSCGCGIFGLPSRGLLGMVWSQIPLDTDVLVVHGPPFGLGDRVDDEHVGCKALRERLREVQPWMVFNGHVHVGRGHRVFGSTAVFNVSTDNCKHPAAVIDVDPSARTLQNVWI